MMLQGYNDWVLDEWCATPTPGRFIPLGLVPMWDAELAAAEVHRLAAKGASRSISFLETPHVQGYPSFLSGPLGPDVHGAVRHRDQVLSLHIGAGFAVINRPPEAPHRPPHGAGLPDLAPSPPRTSSSARPCASSPTSGSPCPRAGSAGSPSTSTASTATCGTRSGSSTTAGAARSPRRCSGSTSSPASSPTRRGSCCGTASASTTSPGSATTRTPTPPGRRRRSWRGASSRRPGCADKGDPQDHLGERLPVLTTGTRSSTPIARTATVGALRALATDVDVTRMPGRSGRPATRPPALRDVLT